MLKNRKNTVVGDGGRTIEMKTEIEVEMDGGGLSCCRQRFEGSG